MKSDLLEYDIKKSLKYFDIETYESIVFFRDFIGDEEIKLEFAKEYEIAKDHFERENSG